MPVNDDKIYTLYGVPLAADPGDVDEAAEPAVELPWDELPQALTSSPIAPNPATIRIGVLLYNLASPSLLLRPGILR
jgi:hypothetical protein